MAFALENLGVPPEEMRRRVDDAMKMAGIYEFRERAPHNLSGGQKQRVAIAGVVAMRPDCLILDEATAMLDPRGREQVMQTIHHLNKDLGITVVSITHYMEEAAQADRVLVMSQGMVMEGTPKEVFSRTKKVRSLPPRRAAGRRAVMTEGRHPHALEGIIDTGECAQALYELLKWGGGRKHGGHYQSRTPELASTTPVLCRTQSRWTMYFEEEGDLHHRATVPGQEHHPRSEQTHQQDHLLMAMTSCRAGKDPGFAS